MGLTRCARASALRISVAAIERRLIRRWQAEAPLPIRIASCYFLLGARGVSRAMAEEEERV